MFSASKRLAIDLGTANTLIYLEGSGVVLNEPTVVALSEEDESILAIGEEAKHMLGRTPRQIIARRPLKDGVVADYDAAESLIRYFLSKVMKQYRLNKVDVLVCAPVGATSVERRAIVEAALAAGSRQAYLTDEALVAAIGAGIPISSTEGNMIVDLGGGTTEIAVISLGGIVAQKTEKNGGNHMDEAISLQLKRKHNLLIGEQMAEEVKLRLASAIPGSKEQAMEVRGRDAMTGLPKTLTITERNVYDAIKPLLDGMVASIKQVLEQTPPELASDIIDRGIVLSGGGALLPKLDRLISTKTGVPVHVAEEPLLCVIRGAGTVMEQFDTFKRSLRKN
jgi:rod shape-determining protein MreB